jgi:hypothetical protein
MRRWPPRDRRRDDGAGGDGVASTPSSWGLSTSTAAMRSVSTARTPNRGGAGRARRLDDKAGACRVHEALRPRVFRDDSIGTRFAQHGVDASRLGRLCYQARPRAPDASTEPASARERGSPSPRVNQEVELVGRLVRTLRRDRGGGREPRGRRLRTGRDGATRSWRGGGGRSFTIVRATRVASERRRIEAAERRLPS